MIDPIVDAANQVAYWAAILDMDFAYLDQGEPLTDVNPQWDIDRYNEAAAAFLALLP